MKNKQLEIIDKIENIQKNFLYKYNEINILDLSEILIDLAENFKNVDEKIINEFLFKFNNTIRKEKKKYNVDILSYNIGILEFFSKMISLEKIKNKANEYIKIINGLSEKQKKMLNIIYYEDGINSKKLREKLEISSQHLYNMTHDEFLSKLLIINDSYGGKFKYYSLTMNCRKYLKEKYEMNDIIKNYNNEFKQIYMINVPIKSDEEDYKSYASRKIKEKNDFLNNDGYFKIYSEELNSFKKYKESKYELY